MKKESSFLEKMKDRFRPALLTSLKEGYGLHMLGADVVSGLIVAIVAVPLAIAFAIASGVSPQVGLTTAVVAGLLIAIFGGSRVQIGGPTGAFIVIVYGVVQQFGVEGLIVATFLAGIILIVLGLCGLGTVIKYVPYPVTVGFTSGIALVIFAGQIPALFGLHDVVMPGDFIGKIGACFRTTGFNPWALTLSMSTIAICFLWRHVTAKVPGSIVAVLLTTTLVNVLGLDVDTIGTLYPNVAEGMSFPSIHVPHLSLQLVKDMFPVAITIALLAGVESLLSAVVSDGMTGRRHNSNTELIAQGIANIVSPLFGGIPAAGAISRTATNVKNGGQTPIAGIVHAFILLLIMLYLGSYAAMIPMATLAGVVAVVTYNMSEWRTVKRIFRSTKSDVLVMMTTILLTVLIDLTVAIQVGVLLAAFLFIRRMGELTEARNVTHIARGHFLDDANENDFASVKQAIPDSVEVFEIYGALFFGAADKFKDTLLTLDGRKPKVLILRMRHVLALDATALQSLEEVYADTIKRHAHLILSGVCSQPLIVMERSGFLDKIGQENVFGHIDEAIDRACELTKPATKKDSH